MVSLFFLNKNKTTNKFNKAPNEITLPIFPVAFVCSKAVLKPKPVTNSKYKKLPSNATKTPMMIPIKKDNLFIKNPSYLIVIWHDEPLGQTEPAPQKHSHDAMPIRLCLRLCLSLQTPQITSSILFPWD